MPRPYNPNTKYGRKKARQEFQHRYHNEYTDEERRENDFWSGCIGIIIVVIIGSLIVLIKGPEVFFKWIK